MCGLSYPNLVLRARLSLLADDTYTTMHELWWALYCCTGTLYPVLLYRLCTRRWSDSVQLFVVSDYTLVGERTLCSCLLCHIKHPLVVGLCAAVFCVRLHTRWCMVGLFAALCCVRLYTRQWSDSVQLFVVSDYTPVGGRTLCSSLLCQIIHSSSARLRSSIAVDHSEPRGLHA